MNAISTRTLETLEFDKICEKLAFYTSFSASRELALALRPSTDPNEVTQRIQHTSEARTFLDIYPEAAPAGIHDIRTMIDRAMRGGILEPSNLLDIASTLTNMRLLGKALQKLKEDQFPILVNYGLTLPEFHHIEKEIEATIDDNATVRDSASRDLGRIRNEIHQIGSRIEAKLNHVVSSQQYAKALQESIITVRNGRYVVPVKAGLRRSIPGLVHDQSASGATLYIEPMPIVELNNRLKEQQLAEEHEINRILGMLSAMLAQEADVMMAGVETLAILDLFFAQARYANTLKCIAPQIETGTAWQETDKPEQSALYIRDARHPLLNQQTVIPINIWMGNNDFSLLIITGPNTGGKTVALKTVGLLTLMAQAGLHIPAHESSRIPVFARVFADIGDEQSIEQSLSTFSSHMSTIIHMLREIGQPNPHPQQDVQESDYTLILLDEIGVGTDPIEGSALARAIISKFLERNCMGIVTTHYADIKVFAYNTKGLQNACVEFDSDTLAPTYRLTIGLPGRSNALAIAARLGLDADIVEQARNSMSQEAADIEGMLADIHHKQEAATSEQQRAEELRIDAQKYRDRLAKELQSFEDAREEHMQDALREVNEELRDARAELRRVREQTRRMSMTQQHVSPQQVSEVEQTEQEVQKLETQFEHIQRKHAETQAEKGPIGPALQVGDTVLVRSIGMSGQITDIDEEDQTVIVQVGKFRINAAMSEVQHEKGSEKETPQQPRKQPERTVTVPEMPDVSMTLDMRGWRIADVIPGLDRYINDAYLSGYPEVRIIHGKGSGALRQAVRDILRSHQLVKSFNGGGKDGGEGVTFARLAEQ